MKEYLPIILTTEGLVYSADYEIEELQKLNRSDISPWIKRKKTLMNLLHQLNLHSAEIEKEANHLSSYWKLENQMMKNGALITPSLLKKAIQLRTCDTIIFHHLCQKLSGIYYDKKTWRCIRAIEIIRDIEADLRQYEADVKSDDFNIYRMFIKAYGITARQKLRQELKERKSLYTAMMNNLPLQYRKNFSELTKRYYEERPPIDVPKMISEN